MIDDKGNNSLFKDNTNHKSTKIIASASSKKSITGDSEIWGSFETVEEMWEAINNADD